MARTTDLKRAKTTATSTASPADDTESGSASVHAQAQLFTPFQTGPSLERIPDDILHEILSYLPTLGDVHVAFGYRLVPPVISSTSLVRTPTLRALSQTSQLLRSRCLSLAWRRLELCGASLPKHNVTFYRAIGNATKTASHVLNACPHLLPLIQTVSVVLTRFQSAEVIPAFADCLTLLPNLATIQVIHAHSQMTTAIKKGFEGKKLPAVRRITLPCSAHEIIKSCPNVEEVTCTEGDGATIIGSLVKGKCQQVRVLRGFYASLTRLVKALPDLKHISVGVRQDITPLADFPFLDTIEIDVDCSYRQDAPLGELALDKVQQASKILKENKSRAEKMVLLTKWKDVWDHTKLQVDLVGGYMVTEAINV